MRWYVDSILLEFASLFSAPPPLFYLPWPIISQSTSSSITIRSMFAVRLIRKKPQNTMICGLNLKLGYWWITRQVSKIHPEASRKCPVASVAIWLLVCFLIHQSLVFFAWRCCIKIGFLCISLCFALCFLFMIGVKLFAVSICPCGLNSRCCCVVAV